MTERPVTRCGECDFLVRPLKRGHIYFCSGEHPEWITPLGRRLPRSIPDWCPLRSGPITIRLRSTDDE